MARLKYIFSTFSNNRKIAISIIVICLVLILSVLIPTLANFMDEDAAITTSVWDGSISSSYKSGSGTSSDPYIISNGSELAYFGFKLEETDYTDTYFELSNNIILNNGSLRYDADLGIEYILDNETYYIEYYTNRYYDNILKNGTEVGTINIFSSLGNFNGHLEGNNRTVYGLYITDSNKEELSLFNKLEGSISNLFFKNALIYGGTNTAGLAVYSDDSILNNIIFDGYVTSKNQTSLKNISGDFIIEDISVDIYEKTDYFSLPYLPFIENNINSLNITGNYEIIGSSEDTTISIDGVNLENGSFNIDINSLQLDSIPITSITTSLEPVVVSFTNLSYNINYNYSLTSGIIVDAKNTVLNSVVNASNVNGNIISSGLIGVASGNIQINNSYNRGNIISDVIASGLVAQMQNDQSLVSINKSYNKGLITSEVIGGLIGIIDDLSENITISNSFEGKALPAIGSYLEASLTVINSYQTNESVNTGFIYLSQNELQDQEFLINNIGFDQFIDQENFIEYPDNIWIYEKDEYPYNYYDYNLAKVIRLYFGSLSYKKYNDIIDNQIIKNKIIFTLEEVNALDSILSKEYYISDSSTVLTKEQLNDITTWEIYNDVNQITDEGKYIVYIKITNYKNEVYYINSDSLILDLTRPEVSLSNGKSTWLEFTDEPTEEYTNQVEKIIISATDNLSGIAYINYFISDEIILQDDLSTLDESIWLDYNDEILLSDIGKNIVYVKVIDNSENITYLNSSYFNYQGYNVSNYYIGTSNNLAYRDLPLHITNKSSFTLNFNYNEETIKYDDLNHYLVTNILLPLGTKITLTDHSNNKNYIYQIPTSDDNYNFNDSCSIEDIDCIKKASYSFSLFKEIGLSVESYYEEINYYNDGYYNEEFTIRLDFSQTDIVENHENIYAYIESISNDEIIRSTIESSVPKFNLYSTVDEEEAAAYIYLTTDYDGNYIDLNTNSVTEIDLTSGINYKRKNEYKVIDTTFEHLSSAFNIVLVDIDGTKVDKQYLKHVVVQANDKTYFLGDDSVIRIPGNSFNSETEKTIKIITYEGNNNLPEGLYYFKIRSFQSIDSYFNNTDFYEEITIPVNVSNNNYNKTGSFSVDMNTDSSVIKKINPVEEVIFDYYQTGDLISPTLRASLYQKEELSAYNQIYNLVDLNNYVTDQLDSSETESYLMQIDENSKFEINFDTIKFENTGYMLIFELYDGDRKIDTVKKYFIVR